MEVERLGRRLLKLFKCKEILPHIKFEFLWLLLKLLILIYLSHRLGTQSSGGLAPPLPTPVVSGYWYTGEIKGFIKIKRQLNLGFIVKAHLKVNHNLLKRQEIQNFQ